MKIFIEHEMNCQCEECIEFWDILDKGEQSTRVIIDDMMEEIYDSEM